ncbi:excinuclease ABC subunit UvrA [Ignavigranum ruoffiae]|uniref:excinuclease ABC subunit UvrA n=1 Tax=Ignavigranum ruoffiae TaxID=89093 RepID=UPI002057E189|nr:excinuclease ABC subunit UvrA [Ignavigranum ruoffiae]UPQ86270.1 excinuclease ABC subunit UvrA [Ignavigranum ruoffiae]
MHDKITVRGARTHNLKNINIEIPKNKLVVMTGLSGSGKSSLAFQTLYAEGQRRYVESLSAYARQFLGQMDKPDVDSIEGLSPAISIDQKTTSHNPRSTVGTATEINDYLRLLYARTGVPYCPNHHIPIEKQSPEQMVNQIMTLPERTKIQILSPLIRDQKGQHKKIFEQIIKDGYVRVRVDGEIYDVTEVPELTKTKKHTIEVVVDRLVMKEGIRGRVFDSVEVALNYSQGYVIINVIGGEDLFFNEHFACPYCDFTVDELQPRLFSFNAPYGACPACDGIGFKLSVDEELVIPDESLSLMEGAFHPWSPNNSAYYSSMLEQFASSQNIPLDIPYKDLSKRQQDLLKYGSEQIRFKFTYKPLHGGGQKTVDSKFEGVMNNIERRYHQTSSEYVRESMRDYMHELVCPVCKGQRLNPMALSVKVGDKNIAEVSELSIEDALKHFDQLEFGEEKAMIAKPILKEINDRLTFLNNVGLNYLNLSRMAGTLSGGEAQRIRLATQIGSNLSGVMYVLDEPSIGLHQRDNRKLINSLKQMRDLGNSLIVVEHDEETMLDADYIIDIGPGAGEKGGEIVAQGTPKQVMRNKQSLTGQYLSGKLSIPVPKERRSEDQGWVKITGASENNLKNVDIAFPLGRFTVVTGVSGSGKSSLVNRILKIALIKRTTSTKEKPGKFKDITGWEGLDKVIDIDQSPIGRTPRSNPATYTGVFDDIRDLFAKTNGAKQRGYDKGRFSFNVKGGRCEACKGAGIKEIEMNFLPNIEVPCEVCHGRRYNSETLEIEYKGKNISQVLDMTIDEALEFFEAIPKIHRKLQTLIDVGLGYVRLGQSATTLSGGEAQRMKLASELQRVATGDTFYILDEPTTGLHAHDIKKLLKVLDRLVEAGNTVVVIEHNLDVIKTADYLIDLGPEGGVAGGEIIATGTPEEVAQVAKSYTGQYLVDILKD